MSNTRKTREINFPVALKTLYDHIVRDNPNTTLTPKTMRAKLRVSRPVNHDRNAPHVYTNMREYDAARVLFDAKYAATLTRAPRKSRAKSNDATPATVDA